MKRVTVLDNGPGHAKGWDPNGATILFTITEANAINLDNTIILANVIGPAPNRDPIVCSASPGSIGVFKVICQVAPLNTSQLHYQITLFQRVSELLGPRKRALPIELIG